MRISSAESLVMEALWQNSPLAAEAVIGHLDGKIAHPHTWLDGRRQIEFRGKLRSNRVLRALVARPLALSAAAIGARVVPSAVERLISYAGDVAP